MMGHMLNPLPAKKVKHKAKKKSSIKRHKTKAKRVVRKAAKKHVVKKPAKKHVAKKRPVRKVAFKASKRPAMTKVWKKKWGAATLAAGPKSPLAKKSAQKWKKGVRKYASNAMRMTKQWKKNWKGGMMTAAPKFRHVFGASRANKMMRGVRAYNPMALVGTLKEVATLETMKHVIAAGAGIVTPSLAPMLATKITGKAFSPMVERLIGGGTSLAVFVGLTTAGYSREARTYIAGAAGGMLAEFVLGKFFPATTAGLGQVSSDVRRAVEREVNRTLSDAGLGDIAQTDISDLGQISAEEFEELSGYDELE